jgi:ribosomal-protein-alanine N-acetyltransferase
VIEQSAYLFPWSRTVFRDCLRAGYVCRVAEKPGSHSVENHLAANPTTGAAYGATGVSGFTLMSIGADEAHILNLCVDPEYHRCGIGYALLEETITIAADMNVSTTFLEVRVSNQAARSLYMAYGFSEIGIRDGYYPAVNGREDAIVLAMHLGERFKST